MDNPLGLAKRGPQPDISLVMMNQPLPPRALIAVEGPDAQAFLNALLTQTIPDASSGAAVYAAMLSPQGKIFFDAIVIGRGDDGFWLDVAASRLDAAVQRLTMFRLNRAVQIAPESAWRAIVVDAPHIASPVVIEDPRRPGALWRAYGPAADLKPDMFTLRASLELGLPNLDLDAPPDTVFGLEALLEELHGVDFHKGCFPGQENVSRMKRRATTRRKFCRVRFDGPPPEYGALIHAGAMDVGDMRSAVGGVGMALLRLDRVREAAATSAHLLCEGRPITTDAPSWLLWPAIEDGV